MSLVFSSPMCVIRRVRLLWLCCSRSLLGVERSGPQPLQKLLKWASSRISDGLGRTHEIAYVNPGEVVNSIFDWTVSVTRKDFLVSSEPQVGILI